MPNSNTFEIGPIRSVVEREVAASDGLWIDPFAADKDYADVTNDLNPEYDCDHNQKALAFLEGFDDGSVDGGVLYDPPYSPRQIKEVYDRVGLETDMQTTQARTWSNWKEQIGRVCAPGATVVSFGWRSGGVGMTHGFEKREILLVPHGGQHNDTICVVEDHRPGGGGRQ